MAFEQNTPENVLASWVRGVISGELEAILRLYHESARLYSTFDNQCLETPYAIRDYFEKLSHYRSVQVEIDEASVRTVHLSGPIHALSGEYRWIFESDDGRREVNARFTFILNLDLVHPIVHHHSSAFPQES